MATLWYAVDGNEYPYFVPFRTPLCRLEEHSRARLAELCAQDYHEQHDGKASRWPIIVELRELPGGPIFSRHTVDLESAPIFLAKTLSAA